MRTLADAAEQIRTRRLSPLELTRECLARIERLDPALNAFITVTGELAWIRRGAPNSTSAPATIAARYMASPSR